MLVQTRTISRMWVLIAILALDVLDGGRAVGRISAGRPAYP